MPCQGLSCNPNTNRLMAFPRLKCDYGHSHRWVVFGGAWATTMIVYTPALFFNLFIKIWLVVQWAGRSLQVVRPAARSNVRYKELGYKAISNQQYPSQTRPLPKACKDSSFLISILLTCTHTSCVLVIHKLVQSYKLYAMLSIPVWRTLQPS